MSYRSYVRVLVLMLVLMALLSKPARVEQATTEARTAHHLLVANYDMRTGRPLLNVVTASQTPRPVVSDVDVRDDTTVAITLYLPYTWPDRGHTLSDTDLPLGSFHLHLLTEVDSSHYFIEFEAGTAHVRPVAIKPAEFLGIARPSAYPANTVMIQLAGNDHQLATDLLQQLESSGEERLLKPDYYCGVPRWIGVAWLGAKQYNETVDGRLIAIELHEPFNHDTYAAMKSLVDAHKLTWFYPPPDKDP